MSQSPISVTYSLEEILREIKQSIKEVNQNLERIEEKFDQKFDQLEGKFDQKFDQLEEKFDQKVDKIDERLTNLEVGQARLEERLSGEIRSLAEKVDGISKRLDYQEFINRGVVLGLILAIIGGLAKLFGLVGNP